MPSKHRNALQAWQRLSSNAAAEHSTAHDIMRYHRSVSDVLIRDIPDDVLAGIDARAAELGLSRVEYIRRRLAQDARTARVTVTRDDLQRLGQAVADLADDDLMRRAWR